MGKQAAKSEELCSKMHDLAYSLSNKAIQFTFEG